MWASAWLHAHAAPDDVIDALHAWAQRHEVAAVDDATATSLDLPGPDAAPGSVVGLLAAARHAGASGARLVLPVSGDVRGLPADAALTPAALDSGEAVVLTGAELALVPAAVAEGVLRWTLFSPGPLPPSEEAPLSEAEHGLRGAVRQAATTLVELDVARHRPGVRAEIADRLDRRVRPPWPEGVPGRALRVLDQADEVEAILAAAEGDQPGGALSVTATRARSEALRPLHIMVRDARRAATAAAVRAVTEGASQH